MTINKISPQINTLAFSYREMDGMGFNGLFIQDYLDQIKNVRLIADSTDFVIDQVNRNTENIESNRLRIALMEPVVESNKLRLDALEPKVEANSSKIETLETTVSDHENRIDTVETRSQNNENAISAATGKLVGNEDFATDAVGGVVFLANLISDLTQITTPDIGLAPAAYDQNYAQSVTDLTNTNKAKINEIVTKINAIIAGQVAAKQMAST